MKNLVFKALVGGFILFAMGGQAAETPLFKNKKIEIGRVKLNVEVAQTPPARTQGLMYRKSMPNNHGMLFVFPTEKTLSFWMKNTLIPLSIGFFTKEKVLTEVIDMMPLNSVMEQKTPSYSSKKAAMYALEVNKGWFSENQVKVGQKFKFIPQ